MDGGMHPLVEECLIMRSVHPDVGADGVEEATGAAMEADDPAASGRRELERHAVLLPVRPVRAPVADERQRFHDEPLRVVAQQPFHARQVLVPLKTDLQDTRRRETKSMTRSIGAHHLFQKTFSVCVHACERLPPGPPHSWSCSTLPSSSRS